MDVDEHAATQTSTTCFGYCYHVAGVVGLMMAHVMGVHEEAARRRAADLGIALQLTNIARDVLEDARVGAGVPAAATGCARPASCPRSVADPAAPRPRWPGRGPAPRRGGALLRLRATWASSACRCARRGPSRWRAASTREIGAWCAPGAPTAWDVRAVVPRRRKAWRGSRADWHGGRRRQLGRRRRSPAAPGAVDARAPRSTRRRLDAALRRTAERQDGRAGSARRGSRRRRRRRASASVVHEVRAHDAPAGRGGPGT